MRKSIYRKLLVGTCAYGALVSGSAFAAAPAPADELPVATGEAAPAPAAPAGEIVVTGTKIARPDYVADSPLVSVGSAAIQNTGTATVEKALSQMPQFAGSFGSSNAGSTSTGLNGGQAYASLRGLGPKRTLILMDGHRMQSSNPDGSTDLNILPTDLISNVEVITGGASTTYGSDATAGVVNFHLRTDIKGLEVNSSYGVSDYGDGAQFKISAAMGGKFADDRGHAVVYFDYTSRDRAYWKKRPYYLLETPNVLGTSTLPQGNVLFGSNGPTPAAVNAVFGKYGYSNVIPAGGTLGSAQVGFNLDGTLFTNNMSTLNGYQGVVNFRDPQTPLAYIATANGSQTVNFGYPDSSNQSDLKRYTSFAKLDYELTPAINAYVQFGYTHYTSVGVSNPSLGSGNYYLTIPYNSYFIPSDLATLLASRAKPTDSFTLYKAFNMAGPRYQGYVYDVWQISGGLNGKLGIKDWTWDIYASIGRAGFNNWQTGGVSYNAIYNLVDAPDGGKSICAGGLNLFGNFQPSQDCVNYISRNTNNREDMVSRTAEANLQGSMFHWWAGDARFALGADYRYNSFNYQPDSAFYAEGTSDILGYSVLQPTSGSEATKEVYAELLLPVLRDLPLVKSLSFDLGYRYSDYNISTVGGVSAYKASADWQVNRFLRFRGGYNRAIRAPSVGELYAPVSTATVGINTATATGLLGDPCDIRSSYRKGANAAQVTALCLAQGLPANLASTYQLGSQQVYTLNGGNPNLKEETTDTFSAGAVISSPFSAPAFRRMTLSVDFYHIKVANAIGPLSIATSFQYCFNVGGNNPTYSATNYYCSLLGKRNTSTGNPTTNSQPLLNLGQYTVQGVDIEYDWRFNLSDFGIGKSSKSGSLNLNSVISYTDQFKIQGLPGGVTYDYAGMIGSQGAIDTTSGSIHPRWKAVTSLTYANGPFSVGSTWRYISGMKDASAAAAPNTTTPGVPSYNVFDFNFRFKTPFKSEFRVGVTNAFNKNPPITQGQANSFDAQDYDVLGRYWSVGLTQKF